MKTDDAMDVGAGLVHLAQEPNNPLSETLLNTYKTLFMRAETKDDYRSMLCGVFLELTKLITK